MSYTFQPATMIHVYLTQRMSPFWTLERTRLRQPIKRHSTYLSKENRQCLSILVQWLMHADCPCPTMILFIQFQLRREDSTFGKCPLRYVTNVSLYDGLKAKDRTVSSGLTDQTFPGVMKFLIRHHQSQIMFFLRQCSIWRLPCKNTLIENLGHLRLH
jgi:hypothetical protein